MTQRDAVETLVSRESEIDRQRRDDAKVASTMGRVRFPHSRRGKLRPASDNSNSARSNDTIAPVKPGFARHRGKEKKKEMENVAGERSRPRN